jgi:hypothetical protein
MFAGQVVQVRSEDGPAAAVSYVPAGQVVVARHTRSANAEGAVEVYCPLGHTSLCVLQSRSELAVGALCSYSPSTHTVTVLQASPLVSAEKVVPATHA